MSASTWLEWIWSQSLQIAIVATIVWIAVRLWASSRPHLAHSLWAIVLIKCVVPPIGSPIGVMNWIDLSCLLPMTFHVSESSNDSAGLENQSGQDSISGDFHAYSEIAAPAMSRVASSTEEHANWPMVIWNCTDWLPVLLISGAMFSVVWMAVRYGHFLLFIRVARTVDRPDLDDCTLRLCKTLGIRQLVRIKVLESPIGPAVIGWLRPTLLLPRLIVKGRSAQAIAIVAGCLLLPSSARLVAQTKVEAISQLETLKEMPVIDSSTEPPKDWSLQIRFATMEPGEFSNLAIEWSLASSLEKTSSIDTASTTKRTASSPSVFSASVVEKNSPVLYSILKVDETIAMLEQVQKRAKTNVLNAPRIRVPDSQTATVANIAHTPYAAGNQKGQIVDSGTKINVRPSFRDGNIVRLNCDLSISDVSSHEKIEVQLKGKTKTSIEVPEVAKTNIECELDLPFHETLVLTLVSGENKNPILVMITCEPGTHSYFPDSIAEFAGLASSVPGKNDQASGDLLHPVVVMGPLEGLDSKSTDAPPSDDEIVHAFESSRSTTSPVMENKQKRLRARITTEKTKETAEPARFVPLIGYASLRHAIYKCKIEIVTTDLLSPSLAESTEEHLFYVDYTRFRMVDEPESTLLDRQAK